MMKSAKDAILSYGDCKPILMGVTVLTSISSAELSEIGTNNDLREQVVQASKARISIGFRRSCLFCRGSKTFEKFYARRLHISYARN